LGVNIHGIPFVVDSSNVLIAVGSTQYVAFEASVVYLKTHYYPTIYSTTVVVVVGGGEVLQSKYIR
jgi:hypothetical protein